MKIGINYADDNFKEAQRLNSKTAYKNGNFDKVFEFGPGQIDVDFRDKFNSILSQRRGGGYWLWKPYILNKTINQYSEFGDYIFYGDSGSYYINKIDHLIACMERSKQDIMGFELPLIEKQWTKRDTFVLLDADYKRFSDTNQMLATFILFKKTEFTVRFVKEYLEYCCDIRALSDLENNMGIKNYEEFTDHRHDQSIFSLLYKKSNLKPFRDPSQFGERAWMYYGNDRLFNPSTFENSDYPRIVMHYRNNNLLKFKIKEGVKDAFTLLGINSAVFNKNYQYFKDLKL